MHRVVSSISVLLLLTTVFFPTIAAANEPPLADAGLDQHVARGSTALLDASGSHDPDGRIERYEWSIRTPDGRTITPNCRTCPQTRFHPNEVGQYAVSLSVTDEDGTSSHDTLYVTVSPGDGPSVDVSGPQNPHVGEQSVYSVTVDAGAAPLDHVVWSLDGRTVATDSLSGGNDAETLTRTFSNTGTRTVTATAYDTDGQTDTDSLRISVQANRAPPSVPRNTLADRFSPTISGDKLITGTTPLRGTYSIQSTATSSQVRSITWLGDGAQLGNGRALATKWKPGDHSLYALVTYSDGSRTIARFSDGTTTVTADPKPTVKLPSFDSFGSVSGSTYATDAYANLKSVHVKLGGKEIGRTKMDATTPGGMQRHRTVSFDSKDFKPGKKYTLTVSAVDLRGQKTTLTRTIIPSKMPEIVQSGFVNNDVDSYNTRIDPKRYTAHHVTKIKLNGVDPSSVQIADSNVNPDIHDLSKKRTTDEGVLVFREDIAGNHPGKYNIKSRYFVLNGKREQMSEKLHSKSTLHVTPSPPEIRLDVTNDGTRGYNPYNWGIVVDASGSFDPDHTKLRYVWMKGAQPITADNKTAKFSSIRFAELKIKDRYGLTAKKRFNYLNDYVPNVQPVTELSNDPYKPNDTVRLRVTTNGFQFSKNRYQYNYHLGVDLKGVSGSVAEWEKQDVMDENKSINEKTGEVRMYTGIVEIPASELFQTNGQAKIRVYNEDKPETYKEVDIPDVTVYRNYGKRWTNPRIKDTSYLVNQPIYDWKTTKSPTERDQYLSNGYSVDEKSRDGFEYAIQQRTKVADAKYKDVDQSFSTKLQQSAFLQIHPDWWSNGRTAKKRTYTTTEHEWRDSKSGKGTFTGDTRRVQTSPAQYRMLNQYAHRHDVQKTGTKTVRKRKTVTVTKTGTKYVMQCSRYGICMEVPKQYTYTDTVTRTYTTTKYYTYTVTETDYYWSYQKFHYDDWATGKQKRRKVEDAQYETQYYYKYKEQHTDVDYTYDVQTRKKVQDAQYEWRNKLTTTKSDLAMSYSQLDGWRIGEAQPNVRWDLKKQTGSKTTTSDVHLEGDTVLKTYVTAKVDVVKQYVTQDSKIKNESVGNKIVHESYHNFMTKSKIRKRLKSRHNKESDTGDKGLHYTK